MLDTWMCPNIKCWYDKNTGRKGEHCPECGSYLKKVGIMEAGRIINGKKESSSRKKHDKYVKEHKSEIKKEEMLKKDGLFTSDTTDEELAKAIEASQLDLIATEAGTGWMRAGTLLSLNPTEQMVGAGFKAIINQNKIIVRQNEQILRELKKLNRTEG